MHRLHIIISGGTSVGKSTLVQACFEKFQNDEKWQSYHFIQLYEVARDLFPKLGLTGEDLQSYLKRGETETFANVQKQLIHEQIRRYTKDEDKNYLSDRSGFDALAHIHHYLGDNEQTNRLFETEEFQEMIRLCEHGLIFIILPQKELQVATDDLRIHTDYSDQMKYTKSLKYCYEKAALPYFVIADLDLTKRIEFIEQHVNNYIQAQT